MKDLLLCDGFSIEQVSQLCRQLKLGIEVQTFCVPELYIDNNPEGLSLVWEEIKGISSVSMHGPYRDLNTGSADPLIRNVTKYRYQKAYDIAAELNISNMILHNGSVKRHKRYSEWLKYSISFWHDFLADKPVDFTIQIENVYEVHPELLCDIIEGINNRNVKVCLDIGHAHCYSEETVMKWVCVLKDRIGYVHMHDNDGTMDSHLDLGNGSIPLKDVCASLEQYSPDAIWAIEADCGNMVQSIDWLANNNFIK
jgi:sugar phosphate isomerase/epimerase